MMKRVIIKPVAGDEAGDLLRQSDDYMASLYPTESNHLVDPDALLMMFARVVLVFSFLKAARLTVRSNGFMLIQPIAARQLPAS